MIKNYFKIAWRNIKRNKIYTFINIAGLSLGISACIVIYLISSYEFGFDNFHPGKNRIYRVMGNVTENSGKKIDFGRVPLAVSQYGHSEISGIDAIAGIIPYNAEISIPVNDKPATYFKSRLAGAAFISTAITEPQYFDIFKYEWLAGNAATALTDPYKVVLTETKAHQYFGNIPANDIIGKQVIYDDSLKVAVSGIVKDWEKNSDLNFTDFISYATIQSSFLANSFNAAVLNERDMPAWTFAKLSNGTTPAQIDAQMNKLVQRHSPAQTKLALWAEPLSAIHFNADVIENPFRTADKSTLYTLLGIAAFIVMLAIINFINLATAQSIRRAKEVGVRKVLGSSRAGLIAQFLTETFLLTFCAVFFAVLLVKPVLTAFHSFIPNGVTFNFFVPSTIIFLVTVTLVTALLAGVYPAKILSAHLPVLSLKGSGEHKAGDKWLLRKGLIVFQFSVSLIFIISGIVMASQLKYTRQKNPGFNADAIVTVNTPRGDSASKISVLAEQVKQLPGVSKVALQWVSPMVDNGRGHGIKFNSSDIKETGVVQVAGNEDFIPLYGIKLLAGRNLVHADSMKEIIINENLCRLMGNKKPEEAIGKMLYWDDKPYPVVGVVADFHSRSFHEQIAPLCIVNRPNRQGTLAIKLSSAESLSSNSIKTTLSQIQQTWKQIYPAATFDYQFYDETLALLYQKDQQTATLVNTAMAVTIFISCIGLFGLALFTTERKAKEISIRKILGAGIGNIAIMLSKDFVILVTIAFLIASPVAWYFMNKWLQGFAYRIHISWWMFIAAGVTAILIALFTVSFQAIKAAVANPVKSLRTE